MEFKQNNMKNSLISFLLGLVVITPFVSAETHRILDEGDQKGFANSFNCIGSFIACNVSSNSVATITITSPTIDVIGDATANGSIDFGVTEQDIIGQLDSAGKSMLTLTNQDADRANSTTILSLHDYDTGDPESVYLDLKRDVDGTPGSDYLFAQNGANFTQPLDITLSTTTQNVPLALEVNENSTAAGTGSIGIINTVDVTNTGATGLTSVGLLQTVSLNMTGGTAEDIFGEYTTVGDVSAADATITFLTGNTIKVNADGDSHIVNVEGLHIQISGNSSGTVDRLYGSRLDIVKGNAVLSYGFYEDAGDLTANLFASQVQLGIAGVDGQLKFFTEDGATDHYTLFQPGTQSTNITYTLPTATPATDGQLLSSTTAGVLTWAATTLHFVPLASAPASCTIGDFYVDTSGAYCACTSTNTWSNMTTLVGSCA